MRLFIASLYFVISVLITLLSVPLMAQDKDDVVPFISPYGTYFASDDPFPGEDVISYCEAMANEYNRIRGRIASGTKKEPLKMEIFLGAMARGAFRPEIQRAMDQVETAYAAADDNEVWDLPTWVAYGQDCVNRRLRGTWYSYDWKSDPVFPIELDRKTQRRLSPSAKKFST